MWPRTWDIKAVLTYGFLALLFGYACGQLRIPRPGKGGGTSRELRIDDYLVLPGGPRPDRRTRRKKVFRDLRSEASGELWAIAETIRRYQRDHGGWAPDALEALTPRYLAFFDGVTRATRPLA